MSSFGRQLSVASSCASRRLRSARWNHSAWSVASIRRRSLHSVRKLPYPEEDGVGDFLPPAALKTVLEWQAGLLERLNDQVKNTHMEDQTVLQTIIETSNDAEHIRAFNYASLAANNNFFLNCIKPRTEGKSNIDEMSPELMQAIATQFSDFGLLQERFVASASGMASSGWLWLVTDGLAQLAVVPTFGSGTLLVRHRVPLSQIPSSDVFASEVRRNAQDSLGTAPGIAPSSPHNTATSTSPLSGVRSPQHQIDPHTPARSFHNSGILKFNRPSVLDSSSEITAQPDAQRLKAFSAGTRLFPLFCISIHEHAWLSSGLGVWGKEEYVRRFFSVIDWKSVSETYGKFLNSGHRGSVSMS